MLLIPNTPFLVIGHYHEYSSVRIPKHMFIVSKTYISFKSDIGNIKIFYIFKTLFRYIFMYMYLLTFFTVCKFSCSVDWASIHKET